MVARLAKTLFDSNLFSTSLSPQSFRLGLVAVTLVFSASARAQFETAISLTEILKDLSQQILATRQLQSALSEARPRYQAELERLDQSYQLQINPFEVVKSGRALRSDYQFKDLEHLEVRNFRFALESAIISPDTGLLSIPLQADIRAISRMPQEWMRPVVNLHPKQTTIFLQGVLVIPWYRSSAGLLMAQAELFTDSNPLEKLGRKLGLLDRFSSQFVWELTSNGLKRYFSEPEVQGALQTELERLFEDKKITPWEWPRPQG